MHANSNGELFASYTGNFTTRRIDVGRRREKAIETDSALLLMPALISLGTEKATVNLRSTR